EPTALGQHADAPGTAGGILAGKLGRVGDLRKLSLGRRGALHLGDHADARGTQGGVGVQRLREPGCSLLQRLQRHRRLARCHVVTDPGQNLVEYAHAESASAGLPTPDAMRPMVGVVPSAAMSGVWRAPPWAVGHNAAGGLSWLLP